MDIVDDATPQLGIFVQGLRQHIGVSMGGGQNGEVRRFKQGLNKTQSVLRRPRTTGKIGMGYDSDELVTNPPSEESRIRSPAALIELLQAVGVEF